MPKLLHFTLDPYGRRMRMALAEYGVHFDSQEEKPWQPSELLLTLNPSGLSPVYIEDGGLTICGAEALTEYLEETQSATTSLIPGSAIQRAEVRRLAAWFDVKFYTEVTEPILTERVIRRFAPVRGTGGSPDMGRVRASSAALKVHLDYLAFLAEQRSWLAGNDLSLADLAAAAHLSALDYLGLVAWADFPVAQSWFVRIKSRPSFRSLLLDHLSGVAPAAHYAELDF